MDNSLKTFASNERKAKTSTPQTRRTPGRTDEARNNAGGFTFKVTDKDRLERFLILGTDGGTYYVSQESLTKQNVDFVKAAIKNDERMVVDTVVDVSSNGRAAKNSPALFVMALVFTEGADKAYAREALPKVARTSTHLFEFAEYIKSLGGWGRAKRNAIADWYTSQDTDKLAYQAVKYRQRNGWTHRDLFRLAHPKGVDKTVGSFILGNDDGGSVTILNGFRLMQTAASVGQVVTILKEHRNLPWETIPTQFLNEPEVWKTLFENGAIGQTALLRNITRFDKIGLFNNLTFKGKVAAALRDEDRIVKGRVHPVQYANALGIYKNGKMTTDVYSYDYGSRERNLNADAKILGALEDGFYASFKTVEPANKATSLWIDVSGSMTWAAPAGLVGMNYMEAAAVMAMVTLRTEPYVEIHAFDGSARPLSISERDSLDTVQRKLHTGGGFGRTDCSQPMLNAINRGVELDTFVVYTDNETWAGNVKPFQALKQYRSKFNRDARLAVVAMAATEFTIADPSDRGMMDFVGFDSNAPRVLADFSAGRI